MLKRTGIPFLIILSLAVTACTGCSRGQVDNQAIAAVAGMDSDPLTAVQTMRAWQYAGHSEPVTAFTAPVSWEMVINKSVEATQRNVERIAEGVYGYAVLEAHANGDAAVAVLLVAEVDGDEPRVLLAPFYMLRMAGSWHYLPNPLEWDTWYHGLEDAEEAALEPLDAWYAERAVALASKTDSEPLPLIQDWLANRPPAPQQAQPLVITEPAAAQP